LTNAVWASADPWQLAAFAALTLALIALWLPRQLAMSSRLPWWGVFFAGALVAAAIAQLVDLLGLVALLALGASCVLARGIRRGPFRVVAHAVMLSLCAALLLHAVPGFDNPRVLDAVLVSPNAVPYTKYLNFDKGVVGLFVLGLYAPDRAARDPLRRYVPQLLWQFAAVASVVLLLSLAAGFVRWDPKFPAWSPAWLWSMVFLTALPEETLFRGLAQEWLTSRLGPGSHSGVFAAIAIGVVFGVAHLAGGPVYVALAAVAGAGYGWIYASTGSLAAAIAAHAGLNTLQFLFFSYPAIALRT